MKKTITLLTLATLLAPCCLAGPVTPQRAATVADAFWRSAAPAKADATLTDRSADWAYNGIYLFTNPAGGFVLVAADDQARPILGYSPTGTLDPDNMPLPLQEWLQGYQQQIDLLRTATQATPSAAIGAEWHALQQGISPKGGGAKSVAPLLSTNWDQDYPYNLLCPGNTVTGCAATAQAQLMKYWNYPAFGTGKHHYTHSTYGSQSADFAHTLYDWDNMPAQCTYTTPDNQNQAVAQLMYHVGVSLEMAYGTAAEGGSAALGLVGMPGYASIDNSLKDYFGYSQDMEVVYKDYGYTNDQWRTLLIQEIDNGRPVLYTGSATQGGHGFICDGYDERQYMHFNFGWSGVGDGYFPVDSISPGVGGAGGNGTYTFNLYNAALLNAKPDYRMRVSDTLFNFTRNGGTDSVLFCINDTCSSAWSVSSSAAWLTVEPAAFSRAGWVRFSVEDNDASGERMATLTFTQGSQTATVRVVQANFSAEDMCPLMVVTEATHGDGWQGDAHLTLESAAGYIFGTARLTEGSSDSVEILVAPHDVYSVWHSGGATDRYINYSVRNQYGETFVDVEYAYRNGGRDFIEWPCAHLGIESPAATDRQPLLYPNPANDMLHIEAEGLERVELLDVSGRRVLTSTQATLDLSQMPAGPYFVRITTAGDSCVKRIVKQ